MKLQLCEVQITCKMEVWGKITKLIQQHVTIKSIFKQKMEHIISELLLIRYTAAHRYYGYSAKQGNSNSQRIMGDFYFYRWPPVNETAKINDTVTNQHMLSFVFLFCLSSHFFLICMFLKTQFQCLVMACTSPKKWNQRKLIVELFLLQTKLSFFWDVW